MTTPCPHDHVSHEPADHAVGIMSDCTWCEDCGTEIDVEVETP